MIKHIVFFQFPQATPELLATLKTKLESMKGRVPSLQSLEVGIDFSRSERSFDAALTTTHLCEHDLKSYATDPVHLEVVNWIKEQGTLTKVVDYEID